jgi:uncharacterized membrane protein YhaH (DUF805 family)
MECPFCKEEIKEDAIKCKHCNSNLSQPVASANAQAGTATQAIVEQAAFSYYTAVWKKYATFSGRARRKEYWFFGLFNLIAAFLLGFVDGLFGTLNVETGLGLFAGVYNLAVFIPSLAVAVRRLHDIGRSGWWLLLALIPIIGWIILIVWTCSDSHEEPNEHGTNPKYEVA